MKIHHWGFLKPSAILTAVLALFLVRLTRQEATAETSNNEATSSLERGQAIFADTCGHCHAASPRPFKTAPEFTATVARSSHPSPSIPVFR